MKYYYLAFTIFLFFNIALFSQVPRETRAVWVTTNFQLDWPPKTFNQDEQKQNLENIFTNLKKKNFNTVYFQVRSNGTVMYQSDTEPFSPYFTGIVDQHPNYDPLEYAIGLGKKKGIEVHAWVNMVRCFSGSDERILNSEKHIRNIHPEWTERVMSENGTLSYWLNPGIPEVQDYMVNLLLELSTKYDLDGIHLDFFRYPGENFLDDKQFSIYGLGLTKEDWRRNNLTNILRKFKDKVNPKNQFLKLGVTPIGIRKSLSGASGWEGYSSVFQDTEKWLDDGLVDYLTPQIYWDFTKNPKFNVLADDWVKKSYNKNIVLGLAAYKDDVFPELNKMIQYSREIGAAGISFFRYDNIADIKENYFTELAFPSNMTWKEISNPIHSKIISLTHKDIALNEVLLKWNGSNHDSNSTFIRYYGLFNTTTNKTKTKLISPEQKMVRLKFATPKKLAYNYRVGEITRLWNIINLSYQVAVKVPYLEALKKSSFFNFNPMLYKQTDTDAYLSIPSNLEQDASLDFITIENIGEQKLVKLKLGENIFKIEKNFRLIKTLKIDYLRTGITKELNFIN